MRRVPRIVWMVAALALLVAPGAIVKGCRSAAPPAPEVGAPRILAAGNANNLYVVLAEGAGDEASFTYGQRDAAGLWHEPGFGKGGVAAVAAWREHLVVFFPTGRYGLFGLETPQVLPSPAPVWTPLAAASDGLAIDVFGRAGDEPVHARCEDGKWKISKIEIPIKLDSIREARAARYKGRLFLAWREEVPALAAQGPTGRLGFAYLDDTGWKGPYPPQGSPGLAMDSLPEVAATAGQLLCLYKAPPGGGKPAGWALAAYTEGDENWHEVSRLEGASLASPLALARWRDQFCVATAEDGRPRVAPLAGQPLGLGPLAWVWPAEAAETPPGVGWVGGLVMAAAMAVLLLVLRWRGRALRDSAAGQAAAPGAEPYPLGRRVLAAAADHLLMMLLILAGAGTFWPGEVARWWQNPLLVQENLALQLAFQGAVLVYTSAAEALTGRTIGKALFGLEVRSTTGLPISAGQAILRNVLRLIDGMPGLLYLVGLLAILIGPAPQRLGDRLARTIVVRRLTGAPPTA